MRQATEHISLADLSVADVLTRWPQTAAVFLRRRLACVGCLMSSFEQLEDVPRIYGFDPDGFFSELEHAIQSGEQSR